MCQMRKRTLSRDEWTTLIVRAVIIVLFILIVRFWVSDQLFDYLMRY
jgi:hypothetical protein